MNQEVVTRAGKFWAFVPALLLGSMLAGLGVATYYAVDDPHFALEPNYYDKAVHWDQARAEARRSAESGISARLEPLIEAADGSIAVRLHLSDRAAAPVRGASLSLEAFPNAYANRVQHLVLQEAAPGLYVGQLRRASLGLWELRLKATRAELDFQQVLRQDVAKGGAA